MAMRDKKTGDALHNAHIMGTFRRILKLLFFGIKPVFVFDGDAPMLKKRTILARKARKTSAKMDHRKTAQLLVTAQLRKHAADMQIKKAQQKAQANSRALEAQRQGDEDFGDEIGDDAVYADPVDPSGHTLNRTPASKEKGASSIMAGMLASPSPSKKYQLKDQYALPSLDGPLEARAGASDQRLPTAEEVRQFQEEDLDDLDMDSEFFKGLPDDVKYDIVMDLRMKSRQVNYKRVQDMKALATPLDFSMSQVKNLMNRNHLTQKLFTVTGALGTGNYTEQNGRVAGERNKEYVLVKADNGWVLGSSNPAQKETGPITINTSSDVEDDGHDSDEEILRGVRVAPYTSDRQTAEAARKGRDTAAELERRKALAIEAIKARYLPDAPKAELDPYLDAPAVKRVANSLFESDQVNEEDPEVQAALLEAFAGNPRPAKRARTQLRTARADLPVASSSGFRAARQRAEPALGARVVPLEEVDKASDDSLEYVDVAPVPTLAETRIKSAPAPAAAPSSDVDSDEFEEVDVGDSQPAIKSAPADKPTEVLQLTSSPPLPEAAPEPDRPVLGRKTSSFAREGTAPTFMDHVLDQSQSDSDLDSARSDSPLPQIASPAKKAAVAPPSPAPVVRPTPADQHMTEAPPAGPTLEEDDEDASTQPAVVREAGAPAPAPTEFAVEVDSDSEVEMEEVVPEVISTPVPAAAPTAGAEATPDATRPELDTPLDAAGPPLVLNDETPEPEDVAGQIEAALPPEAAEPNNAALPAIASENAVPPATASHPRDDDTLKGADLNEADDELRQLMADAAALEEGEKDEEEPEEFFEWESSPEPAPKARSGGALFRARNSDSDDEDDSREMIELGSDEEGLDLEEQDAAEQIRNLKREEREYAQFSGQLMNKSAEQMRAEAQRDVASLLERKNQEQRNADGITQQMVLDIKALLELFGIPFVEAPQEAEAECADLLQRGQVDGIVTDDSDVFLFGGNRVYRNFFADAKMVECYLVTDFERELGLDRDELVRLAYLLGGDYNDGLLGIGPVTAREILREFPGKDGLVRFKEWWALVQAGKDTEDETDTAWRRKFKKGHKKLHMEERWPNPRIAEAYYKPSVIGDQDSAHFGWTPVDLDGVCEYMRDSIGWSQAKTGEHLGPLLKREKDRKEGKLKTQTNLGDYFDVTAGVGPLPKRQAKPAYQSSRLQDVLRDFRKKSGGQVTPSNATDASSDDNGDAEPAPPPAKRKRATRAKRKQAEPGPAANGRSSSPMAGVEDLSATGLTADGEAELAALEAQAMAELEASNAAMGGRGKGKGKAPAKAKAAPRKKAGAGMGGVKPKTAAQRKKDAAAAKAARAEARGGELSSEEEVVVQAKKARGRGRKRVASEDEYEDE